MKKGICFCLLFLFFWLPYMARVSEGADKKEKGSGTIISITIEDGLFSIKTDNIPLDVLLNDFYEKTGVKFITYGSFLLSENVSLTFEKLPLNETVSRILKGYNFVLVKEDSLATSRVIILSPKASAETFQFGFEQKEEIPPISSPASIPASLDECATLEITIADIRLKRAERVSLSKAHDNLMDEEDQKAMNEAKIKRTQKVLGMEACSHLWERALEGLVRIQDEQVTALLISLAKDSKNASIRERATDVLSRNVAISGYKDLLAMEALKNLSTSSEPGVSRQAQQGLQVFESHIQRGKSSPKETVQVNN